MPPGHPARSYPAHDEHSQEKITIAVDPYDLGDKAQIFSTDFRSYGFLPVFLVVTNDGDQAVSLATIKTELVTVKRVKLLPATYDDLMRRMSHPQAKTGPSASPRRHRTFVELRGGDSRGIPASLPFFSIREAPYAIPLTA